MCFEHQIAHTKPHLDKVSANELETYRAKVALLCKGLFLMDENTWLPKSHLDIHPQHHHVEAWPNSCSEGAQSVMGLAEIFYFSSV